MENLNFERKANGIWMPIEIWEDKSLSWIEKILFLEIDSYTSRDCDCFFSDAYIAEFLNVSIVTANRTLSSLMKKGYVKKTRFDGRRRYIQTNLDVIINEESALSKRQSSSINLTEQNYQFDRHTNTITNTNYNKDNMPISEESKKTDKLDTDELFEDAWVAYDRKGSKKKAKEQWKKLSDQNKCIARQFISEYKLQNPEIKYRKDFERYLSYEVWVDARKSSDAKVYDEEIFGVGVYIEHGKKYFNGKEIPMNAKKRPSSQYCWCADTSTWLV